MGFCICTACYSRLLLRSKLKYFQFISINNFVLLSDIYWSNENMDFICAGALWPTHMTPIPLWDAPCTLNPVKLCNRLWMRPLECIYSHFNRLFISYWWALYYFSIFCVGRSHIEDHIHKCIYFINYGRLFIFSLFIFCFCFGECECKSA